MPMTCEMLSEVEAALGRPVPATLRQFVRDCPPAEFRRHFGHFYSRAKDMVRYNRSKTARPRDHMVREPDGAGGFLPERPWPAEWIVVHDADSEWCTFLRPDDPGVWEWFHDHLEIGRVADSLEAYLADSLARKGPPPIIETTFHPTLGELSWNPEAGWWTAQPPGSPGVLLYPRGSDRDAFLAAAAVLVPAAVAAESRVFADAMAAGGWAEFLEWKDGDALGLTADTVHGRVTWQSLIVNPGLKLQYQYQPADELRLELLWIDADASLAVTGQGWAA
jgi:hypothetical protein